MQTLTQYLSNIMMSVLLGLPTEIKELIYFDALSHAATKILVSPNGHKISQGSRRDSSQSLPLSDEVKRINPNGVAALAIDVQYLSDFVETLNNPILQKNLDELRQTVALMQSDNSDEYYDVSTRNKKYGRVDAMNGPLLLEKFESSQPTYPPELTANMYRLTASIQSPTRAEKFTAFSSKFYHRDA